MAAKGKSTGAEYTLDAECELRFEVDGEKNKVTLRLKSGLAEVFGAQLVKGKNYQFSDGAKVAVFSYKGCIVRLEGNTSVCYIGKDTPMYFYLNCHAALENLREAARTEDRRGPVTMIVGPKDVGKSTLCKILLNYAVKVGRRPTFVDLDVSSYGHISIPGTIGALPVEMPSDVADGFSQQAPLVFHFGHKTPNDNINLYNCLVSRLAEICSDRLQANKIVKASGIVINTCGWTKNDGFELLTHAAQAFGVDVILVLDQDRLCHDLVKNLPKNIRVVQVPKSGGGVKRGEVKKINTEDQRVREYFYGSRIRFHPHTYILKWSKVKIYKIPLDIEAQDSLTKLVAVHPGPNLLHHVLSISFTNLPTKDVVRNNIIGFYCVTNVDVRRQTITVLSPQPRPLPNTVLLLSDIQFMDS